MSNFSWGRLWPKVISLLVSPDLRWRAFRYVVSGTSAALATLGTLYLVTDIWGVWYLYGATVGFTVGVTLSFLMQKFFTFRDRKRSFAIMQRQLSLFMLVALTNVAVNATIVFVLVEYFRFWHIVAQVASSAVIALVTFVVYHFIFHLERTADRKELLS